jgi:hypothetical protein
LVALGGNFINCNYLLLKYLLASTFRL